MIIAASILDFSIFGIRILDVVDLLIVAYLFYVIYKLLRGTIAFNIFVGVVLFYAISIAVDYLDMRLLRIVLGPFVVSGVLILIIIFQPEVRQFLLLFGNNTLKGRSAFLDRLLGITGTELKSSEAKQVEELHYALNYLSRKKIGALIVISENPSIPIWNNTGTSVDSVVNGRLLISIFQKESPLHDGAVVISNGRIFKSEVILPVSEKMDLPEGIGLRHRAAVGISERTDSAVFMVSEESGEISYAFGGKLVNNIDSVKLKKYLTKHFQTKNRT